MIDKEEIKIVVEMIEKYKIPNNKMFIKVEEGTYILGAIGEKIEKDFIELYKYNHFFESIKDLTLKTELAIYKAIEECKQIDINSFNPLTNNISDEEIKCYYELENALFRTEMLWDALAQIYNIYAKINNPIEKIYYKKLFKKVKSENKDILNINSILDYLEENFDGEDENIDKGVHQYLVKLRNTMTHRYSLSVTAISYNAEEKFILREIEPLLLYKICFDYNKVMKFIVDVFNKIYEEQRNVIVTYSKRLKGLGDSSKTLFIN